MGLKKLGTLVLAIYLILVGLETFVGLGFGQLTALAALIAGILILLGR